MTTLTLNYQTPERSYVTTPHIEPDDAGLWSLTKDLEILFHSISYVNPLEMCKYTPAMHFFDYSEASDSCSMVGQDDSLEDVFNRIIELETLDREDYLDRWLHEETGAYKYMEQAINERYYDDSADNYYDFYEHARAANRLAIRDELESLEDSELQGLAVVYLMEHHHITEVKFDFFKKVMKEAWLPSRTYYSNMYLDHMFNRIDALVASTDPSDYTKDE